MNRSAFRTHPSMLVGIALILFGGALNLVERASMVCVADEIDLGLFYVNVADILISIGLLIATFASIITKGGKK